MTPRLVLRGSALIVTLVTLAALSTMAAYTLVRVMPRVRMAYQNAAWQEARVAAEAGVDIAMNDLLANATGVNGGAWVGWTDEPVPPKAGKATPLPLLGGLAKASPIPKLTNKGPGKAPKPPPPPPGAPKPPKKPPAPVTTTAPAYLDNVRVSSLTGVKSEVDIRLWGLALESAPHQQWFRIRSMATVALPPRAFDIPANLDSLLRRFSLRSIRPSLRKDTAGKATSVGLPNVSRTVEALVEPIYPFELGVWSGHSVILSSTGAWNIDSFDSSDPLKSINGRYPGRGNSLTQANGSIASSQPRPFDSLYGPLIAANGTDVRGTVATNGGDDPNTPEHENVSGALRVDPARIRHDFDREMPTVSRPIAPVILPPPPSDSPYFAGAESDPPIYRVPGSLDRLRISAPADQSYAIVIMIDGDLDLAGPLIIPPKVTALLYVRGNITFRDNVNSGPWNSNLASQLIIFGDNPVPGGQTLSVPGTVSVVGAFYGPNANISLDGLSTWIGSVAGYSFRVNGGGDGGLHYDEALATAGPPISFRISRYIEDVRQ